VSTADAAGAVGALGRRFADTVVRPLVVDADGEVVRRALRVAVLGTAAFVVIGRVLGYEAQAATATFAVVALDGFAEFSGSPTRRFTRHLGAGLVAATAFPIAELVRPYPWLLLVVTALVTFATYFAGVLGGPFFAARFPIMIAFLFAATAPAGRSMLVEDLTGWTLGTVAAALGSVVLWPSHRRYPVRSLAAELSGLVAAAMVSLTPVESSELLDRVSRLRCVTVTRRLRTGTFATTERILAEVVHQSERLVACLVVLFDDGDGRIRTPTHPDDRAVLSQLGSTLQAVAATIGEPQRTAVSTPPIPLESLRQAIDTHVAATAERFERAGTDQAELESVAVATDTRTVAVAGLMLAELVESWRGGTLGDGGPAAALAGSGPTDSFRRHARLDSLWFRNSLRAAVACTVAVGVVELGVGSGRGFWLTLATISVLRADLATMSRSVVSAVFGTALGFGLASVVLAAVGDLEPTLWLVLPVLLFLQAANGGIHPIVSSAAFTTFVVLIVTITDPTVGDAGQIRLVNTMIGALLALIVTFILWPRVGSVPEGSIAEILRRLANGLRGTGRADSPESSNSADALGCLVDLDRVFDMVSTSAPQSLPSRLRGRLLVVGELVATITTVARGSAAQVGVVPLTVPLSDWDPASAQAARVDLDAAAEDLDELADRIAECTAVAARGCGVRSACVELACERTAQPDEGPDGIPGGGSRGVPDLVRLGFALRRVSELAQDTPAVRHGRSVARVR